MSENNKTPDVKGATADGCGDPDCPVCAAVRESRAANNDTSNPQRTEPVYDSSLSSVLRDALNKARQERAKLEASQDRIFERLRKNVAFRLHGGTLSAFIYSDDPNEAARGEGLKVSLDDDGSVELTSTDRSIFLEYIKEDLALIALVAESVKRNSLPKEAL